MQVDVWKISGSSGFHFGRHGLGQEETLTTMPSDSLFAALVNRLAVSGGAAAVDAFVQPFKEKSPPFALSSTFPFAGGVLFFPVPFAAVGETAKEEDAKKYKRVQYVSEKLFRQLINGEKLADVYKDAQKLGETVLLDASETADLPEAIRKGETPIWSVETRPRVTLGRAAQNSAIYFTGSVTYAKNCGLWFGVAWLQADETRKKQVESLLAELGDSGLGAERSVGFGACNITPQTAITLPNAEGKPWVSLSRYLPRKDETDSLKGGAYKIINVGGWLDSPAKRGQRRRAVNLLEEGATLSAARSAIPGEMADVSPLYDGTNPLGHAVYRSGFALAVEWNGKERKNDGL
jgi:CRISPR-associated protein Csm4